MSEIKKDEYFEKYLAGMDPLTEKFPERYKKRTGDYFTDFFAGFDDITGEKPLMTPEDQLQEYRVRVSKLAETNVEISEQDNKRFEESVEIAKKSAVQPKKEERRTKVIYIDKEQIKRAIVSVTLCAALAFSGINMVHSMYNDINDPLKMSNLSRTIGSMIYDDEENAASILYNNTHRQGETVYYRHDGVAQDLLKLEGPLFDYAFCAVCSDMGANINNKVGIDGRSNINSVIYYLRIYSDSLIYKNAYVANAFEDVYSLNDYLIKYNYVDEQGNPSLTAFKDACDKNAQTIYDAVQDQIGGTTK